MGNGRQLDASAELRNLINHALEHAISLVSSRQDVAPFLMTLHQSGRRNQKSADAPLDALVAALPEAIQAYAHVTCEEAVVDGFARGTLRIEAEERDQPFAIRLAQLFRAPTASSSFRLLGSPEYLGKASNRLTARIDQHLNEKPGRAQRQDFVDLPLLFVEGMLCVVGGSPSGELVQLLGGLVNTVPALRDQVPPTLLGVAGDAIKEAGGPDAALQHLVVLPPDKRKTCFALAVEAACVSGFSPEIMGRLQAMSRLLGIDPSFANAAITHLQTRHNRKALIPPPLLAHAFIAIILADGRFDQEEMVFLQTATKTLPDFASIDLMPLLGQAQQAVQNSGGVIPSLGALSAIPDDTAKQRCFCLTVELGFASGLNTRESALLTAIAQVLGLSPQLAETIRSVITAKFA